MIKQIVLLVSFSLGAILFKTELSGVLDGMVSMHNFIASLLHFVFSDDDIGRLIQDILALLLIPVTCGSLVALAFVFIKKTVLPDVMIVIWVMWLILLITMVAQTGMAPVSKILHNSNPNPVQEAAAGQTALVPGAGDAMNPDYNVNGLPQQ